MLRSGIQRPLVPDQPGVYQFKSDGGRLLYIGKAKNIKKRLQQYFTPSSLRKQDMVAKAGHVERFPTKTEQEALILETQMIAHHQPPYNNLIKGNSAYVYIKIDNHPFPRISTTRYKKRDKAVYIGPKTMQGDLRNFLRMARYLFQRRSCSLRQFTQGVVCSDYHFGQCGGRCAYMHGDKQAPQGGFTPTMSLDDAQEQSSTMIRVVRALFSGRISEFQTYVTAEIEKAIRQEHFEWAAKLRDMYVFSENLKEKQTVVIDRSISGIYTMIQKQGKYTLRVVLTINEGRIIDIIGHHEYSNDITTQQLLAQIEREYTISLQEDTSHENARYAFSQKRIGQKIIQALFENAQRFIDGYTFSRFANEDPASRLHNLETLQQHYHLKTLPTRIECLDISHFGGEYIVGGLSAAHHGVLSKNSYKRYKLKTITNNDDYGSIREILLRRFGKKQASNTLPDLFIIDGGVGQLGVVVGLLETNPQFKKNTKHITFVSIGKGEARNRQAKVAGSTELLHHIDDHNTIQTYPISYTQADRILILLRDEAHRFANAYRKSLASKTFTGK